MHVRLSVTETLTSSDLQILKMTETRAKGAEIFVHHMPQGCFILETYASLSDRFQ